MGKTEHLISIINAIQFKRFTRNDFEKMIEDDENDKVIKSIIHALRKRKLTKIQQNIAMVMIYWSLSTEKIMDIGELISSKKIKFNKTKFKKGDSALISFSNYLDIAILVKNQFQLIDTHVLLPTDYTPKVLKYFQLIVQSWDWLIKIDSITTTSTKCFSEIIKASFFEQCNLYYKTICCVVNIFKDIDSLNKTEIEELLDYVDYVEKLKYSLWKKLRDNDKIVSEYGEFKGSSYYQLTPFSDLLKRRIILMRKQLNVLDNSKDIIHFICFVEKEYSMTAEEMLSYFKKYDGK